MPEGVSTDKRHELRLHSFLSCALDAAILRCRFEQLLKFFAVKEASCACIRWDSPEADCHARRAERSINLSKKFFQTNLLTEDFNRLVDTW